MPSRAIIAAFVGLALFACASIASVSPLAMKAYEISVASSDTRLAMAWHGGEMGLDSIYLQWLDAAARPAGQPLRITHGERYAYEADLQFIGSDALLAWYEKDAASGALTAWLARIDASGHDLWRRQLDAAGGKARNIVVRLSGDRVSTAWIETPAEGSPAIWVQRFDPDGKPQGKPLRAGEASATTWNLNAALDPAGNFYVVYDAALGARASELQLLAIEGDSVRHIKLSEDDGHGSFYPDLSINAAGRAALTWFDEKDGNNEIYLNVGPLADLVAGRPLPSQRITHTQADSIGAYLTWNGDRLGLAWCDATEGQQEVYAQTFDASGASTMPISRLTHTPAQSSIPSVRPWRRGFVIGWNEYVLAPQGGGHAGILSSSAATTVVP